MALLTMEAPMNGAADAIRDEKLRVLNSMRPRAPPEVVRGQFRGYRGEDGVSPASQVETFAALRPHIDNARWEGVPFYIRAGKQLPVTCTEVMVQLNPPAATPRRSRRRFSPPACRNPSDHPIPTAMKAGQTQSPWRSSMDG